MHTIASIYVVVKSSLEENSVTVGHSIDCKSYFNILFLKVSMNMSIQHFDRHSMIDNRRNTKNN
jgi:hypothetical protein